MTITIDPTIEITTRNYLAALAEAKEANTDAQAKLKESQAKLAELKRRLGDGDTTVTVPQLQGGNTALERCELIAAATSRKLDALERSPKLPPVGLAQVLAEALDKLYPIACTITTNRDLMPEELPHLVIVAPMRPAQSKGDYSVTASDLELVLHRRSALERHHDAKHLERALEAIGWQVSTEGPDEDDDVVSSEPQVIRVRVRAGFEAVPERADVPVTNGFEIGSPFSLTTGGSGEIACSLGTLRVSWNQAELEARTEDGVTTTIVGVRVAGWEQGVMKGELPRLVGIGEVEGHRALSVIASRLPAGLLESGRIIDCKVEPGLPAWEKTLPELKAQYVDHGGVDATYGGRAVRPIAAAFIRLKTVRKARPETAPADDHTEDEG